MLDSSVVQRYGAKTAVVDAIKKATKLPVRPHFGIPTDQGPERFRSEFDQLRKPVIVRSSSPFEAEMFDGIFYSSEPDVYSWDMFLAECRRVRESARSEVAFEYAALHETHIDGRIGILVQEASTSKRKGAMLRHPNDPDLIHLAYKQAGITYAHVVAQDGSYNLSSQEEELSDHERQTIIDANAQLEEALGDGRTLLTELGLDPLDIFQTKPFKRIETADFDLPQRRADDLYGWAFGITPADGVVLPAVRTMGSVTAKTAMDGNRHIPFEGEDATLREMLEAYRKAIENGTPSDLWMWNRLTCRWNEMWDERFSGGYCLVTTGIDKHNEYPDLSSPHMSALISGSSFGYLTHNVMRMIRQADLCVLSDFADLSGDDFYRNLRTGGNVRIISNGKEAIARVE